MFSIVSYGIMDDAVKDELRWMKTFSKIVLNPLIHTESENCDTRQRREHLNIKKDIACYTVDKDEVTKLDHFNYCTQLNNILMFTI